MIPSPKIALHYSDVSSTDMSKALSDPNRSFTLVYWEIVSVGGTARDILAFSKTKNWKSEHPTMEEWKGKEIATPLSYFPVLKVKASNGQEVVLAEALVIDVYLAEEFGLLGDNKYEELTIKAFNSSSHFLMERFFRLLASTTERKQNVETFIDIFLPKFIYDHEFHLRNNGNNGHYVGSKLSLADIHLANVVHLMQTMPFGKRIDDVFSKSEPIRKVIETVLSNPEISAWRTSDEFRRLEKGSHKWYAQFTIPDSPLEE
ncbi:hypothetical protein BG003_001783 [Podila horticola]|nr:hypothetical protein BG003_001783 [Podila horticola]